MSTAGHELITAVHSHQTTRCYSPADSLFALTIA